MYYSLMEKLCLLIRFWFESVCLFVGKFSKCQLERHNLLHLSPSLTGKPNPPPSSLFLPECNEDGSYMQIQCQESFCWCVNKEGQIRAGTKVQSGKPDCTKGRLLQSID